MAFDRTVTTVIDQEKCEACGECIKVCSQDTITMVNKKATITGNESLICDHCQAACKSGAIRVGGIDESLSNFSSFKSEKKWIPHGEFDTVSLVNLMQSRRSCRNYSNKPVEKELLEDLVKIGVTAPSGSNCQMWSFTVLPDRKSVEALGEQIKKFFHDLNRLAAKGWLRMLLKLLGKRQLSDYYDNYYERIKEGLEEWEAKDKDMLFHQAPAVIVIACKQEASCPAEDALLAAQNILLGAHSMGLGTCLIGFAVSAMKKERKICNFIDLPNDEEVYAVIAIGYPKEKYINVTGRKPFPLRFINR
ncbi:nitroreductase family protein [bacterium]|nr:nitroreductase family protein [bacterium]